MGTAASLTVTFISEETATAAEEALAAAINAEISLVLDEGANNEATSFSSGTPVYVRQFPSGEFTAIVNIGSVTKRLRGTQMNISEELVYFANTNVGTLDYLPNGAISYIWVGNDLGNPRFNGRRITLPASGVGVLKCSYSTLYDQLRVIYSGNEALRVMLVVVDGENQDSLMIEYTGVSEIATRPVIITVKNYCSDEVIVGADIELSAVGYPTTLFTTNSLGQADLGYLTVGITYNIKITATGYRDSDADSLSNDSFTVTAEGA